MARRNEERKIGKGAGAPVRPAPSGRGTVAPIHAVQFVTIPLAGGGTVTVERRPAELAGACGPALSSGAESDTMAKAGRCGRLDR